MDLNHSRCDCHECTQQRAREGFGGLAAGLYANQRGLNGGFSNTSAFGQSMLGTFTKQQVTREEVEEMIRQAIKELQVK